MSARILRSKIAPPRLADGLVARSRLLERLEGPAAVWLISAAAGYGKTTLVAQFVDAHDLRAAWVRLDRGDDDPIRFFGHIAAAVVGIDRVDDVIGEVALHDVETIVDVVTAAIEDDIDANGPLVLALDDLHEVSAPIVHELFGRMLVHPPAGLTVAITTRVDPPLPIGRLRAQSMLVDVRAVDLTFTDDEVSTALASTDRDPADAFVQRSEGWPTAIRMLASAGPAMSADPADADLADFLAAEVLAAQPPGVQRFLVETSLLDDLCPTSCELVTGREDATVLLRDLHRRQVFTELLDAETDTYRYHGLFRAFLRRRSEELAAPTRRELHRRAAAWYETAEQPTQIIEHALAAGDDELALSTLRTWFNRYAQLGLIATAHRWIEMYGVERARAAADLRTAAAWAALNAQRYDEVPDWLAPALDADEDGSYRAQAHAIRSHRHRHLNQLADARREAEAAALVADEHDDGVRDWSFAYAVGLMCDQLDGVATDTLVDKALAHGERGKNASSLFIAHSTRALADSLDPARGTEADHAAAEALAFITTPTLERFHQPVGALVAQARRALGSGRVGDAGELAQRAVGVAVQAHEPALEALAHAELARSHHARGASDEARAALRTAEQLIGESPTPHLLDLVRRVRNETRFVEATSEAPAAITERELAVLRLLPHGLTRREIGEQLYVSENTVKTHMTSLRHKLGVSGRAADLVARARDLNLLDADDG